MLNFLNTGYTINLGSDLSVHLPENIQVVSLKALYPEPTIMYSVRVAYDSDEHHKSMRLHLTESDYLPGVNPTETAKLLHTSTHSRINRVGSEFTIVEKHLNVYQLYYPTPKQELQPPSAEEIDLLKEQLRYKMRELEDIGISINTEKTDIVNKLHAQMADFSSHVAYHRFMFDEKIKKCNLKFTPEEKEKVFATWPVETIPLYDLMYSFIHQLYDV